MTSKRQLIGAGILGLGALIAGVMTAHRKTSADASKGATNAGAGADADAGTQAIWSLTLPTPSGGDALQLKAFQGRPLLINFWATWCAPCVEEMPLLDQFHQQERARQSTDIHLLGIAADKAESVVKFLAHTPVHFPIALAGFDGIALSKRLGNQSGGLPYSVLIAKNGSILFTKEGQLTADELKTMRKLVER
ncbi:MAG: TlpA disulfide reductase family protein [Cytophagales bacterium]|nr:TlpA disulfide reductase family protein [Cytophagales bacterium]